MKPVAVFYATREGHTRRIAEAVARGLNRHGLQTTITELGRPPGRTDLDRYAAVALASPVHMGRYGAEAIAFAKTHRAELERMPTAFFSVSLTEASVERSGATPKQHARFVAYLKRVNERFFRQTGWHPARAKNVAGALVYSRYNFLLRWVMKLIAMKSGSSTDTSRDHVYTDWAELDAFVATMAGDIVAAAGPQPQRAN